VRLGNLTSLLEKIDDAIALETETLIDRRSSNAEFVERVAEQNVLLVKRQVMERSPLLAAMIRDSQLALVGGMYDVDSGEVEFYDSRMLLGVA
jgi:carbonic anhydrase